VKGYFLSQELQVYLSKIQRYKPDCLVLLDGVNDLFGMLRFGDQYEPYDSAGFREQFERLTKPGFLSLTTMSSTWLLSNSAVFRLIRERVTERYQIQARQVRSRKTDRQPGLSGLTPSELRQYQGVAGHFPGYLHTVRQIHFLAKSDGVEVLFALQPQLAVTRKQLTPVEARLLDYWWKNDGTLYVYGFQTLYPRLVKEIFEDARKEGYHFLDLTTVFDSMSVQAFTDCCHLTWPGNQAVADSIYQSLAEWTHQRAAL
jgi:hypothetical protein